MMSSRMARLKPAALLGLILTLALAGCQALGLGETPTPQPPTDTPLPPSPTAEPAAALVAGTPITQAAYEAELRRFELAQAELGIDLATKPGYRPQVLQALIDRRLLSYGAQISGLEVDESQAEARLASLAADVGGEAALAAWLTQNEYTTRSFVDALKEEMQAQNMIEQITGAVPDPQEQVRARHILVATAQEAEDLLAQLDSGVDFGVLAAAYSRDLTTRPGGGDLGWFPSGVLAAPEVEAAAFTLQPGELYDGVVESALGYHLVQVTERGLRPLSPEARRRLQLKAVDDWLDLRRSDTEIIILVETG